MVNIITENGITFNRAGTASSWRLVYATGATSSIIFHAIGTTDTMMNIEEFETEAESIARMTELNMSRKTL